jgi:tetratricopeptide (TPR) repeat protein
LSSHFEATKSMGAPVSLTGMGERRIEMTDAHRRRAVLHHDDHGFDDAAIRVAVKAPGAVHQPVVRRYHPALFSQHVRFWSDSCHRHAEFLNGSVPVTKIQMANRKDADAVFQRALEQHLQGRFADALPLYGAAIRFDPDMVAAHSNRASVLLSLKIFEPALRSADRALELDANFADAWNNRGNALEGLCRMEEALESYEHAIRLNSGYAAAHNNRGNALRALNRLAEALESYDKAIALKPDYVEAYYNRGIVLANLGRREEAVASYDSAILLRPDYAEAHNNKGNALRDLDRLEEALASYDRALSIRSDHLEALNNRGVALRYLQRPVEALESFDTALKRAPQFADAHWNRGLCLLQLQKFEEGWREYEWRMRRADPNVPRDLPAPLWNGEDIAEKSLLVVAEQGLGDTIEFCRYAILARDAGARVTLSVQDKLVRLIASLDPELATVGAAIPASSFDYCALLLSLPRIFATGTREFPAHLPYLKAEPEKAAAWRDRIGQTGFKIGICWQGEKAGSADIGRSFPLCLFRNLATIPGVRLISLQKNAGVEQLGDLPEGMTVEVLGDQFDAGPDAFIDSAAVMESLDLVITPDTALAHLAGALGKPVWVALKQVPDWRWFLERSDSPWYPTMRLFRQQSRGDWSGVFSEIEKEVRELMAEQPKTPPDSAPVVPISWGELIDKLTILEIKSERIHDRVALANVATELDRLRNIAEPVLKGGIKRLAAELKSVNEMLWNLEDRVRGMESVKAFGGEFVSCARQIYAKNDERARLKRMISIALGSSIIEEKRYATDGGGHETNS